MKNRNECKRLHFALSKFQQFIPDLNATEYEKTEIDELTQNLQKKLAALCKKKTLDSNNISGKVMATKEK